MQPVPEFISFFAECSPLWIQPSVSIRSLGDEFVSNDSRTVMNPHGRVSEGMGAFVCLAAHLQVGSLSRIVGLGFTF